MVRDKSSPPQSSLCLCALIGSPPSRLQLPILSYPVWSSISVITIRTEVNRRWHAEIEIIQNTRNRYKVDVERKNAFSLSNRQQQPKSILSKL